MPGGKIFISYRRGPDSDAAARLYDQLVRHFDTDRLVFDIDAIPLGHDFHDFLDEAVGGCSALLAVIGPGWLGAVNRLRGEDDWVRIEIAAALARGKAVPVVPVFVNDARMPSAADLPEALAALPRRNGIAIPHAHFNAVVRERLAPALRPLLEMAREPAPEKRADAFLDAFDTVSDKTRYLYYRHLATDEERATLERFGVRIPDRSDEATAPPAPGTIFRDRLKDGSKGPEVVVIPSGKFMMGVTEREATQLGLLDGMKAAARPTHEVAIAEAFALARYPVTFAEYDHYCTVAGLDRPPVDEGWGRGRRPAINVSWTDAVAYCDWLCAETGSRYRLPSEAEWEYACRAGTATAFSVGDKLGTDLANVKGERPGWFSSGEESRLRTVPVDYPGFAPNGFGLVQMHGNVWELCADEFAAGYETPRGQVPFREDARSEGRVMRGGSWKFPWQFAHSAMRTIVAKGLRHDDVGFRVARALDTP